MLSRLSLKSDETILIFTDVREEANKEGGESKEKEEPKAKIQHHQANPVRYFVEYLCPLRYD